MGVVTGMFQSFYDAPGGFSEEWHEVYWGLGLEYSYARQFALRGGYFFEHQSKGGRQYVTPWPRSELQRFHPRCLLPHPHGRLQ